MARMTSDAKLGYFPAPPDAVRGICEHLVCNGTKSQEVMILDPCCGEGAAIKQIGEHLDIPQKNVHAIELDLGRVEKAREAMPEARIIAADCNGTNITPHSFGLVYLNPPFGAQLGGGKREEQVFAERCSRLVHPKGVLVLVIPIGSVCGNGNFVCFLDSRFQDIAVHRFPDDCRKYKEIVLFCKPRPAAIPDDKLFELGSLHRLNWRYGHDNHEPECFPKLGDFQPVAWMNGRPSFDRETEVRLHVLPWSWKPSKFEKCQYTREEFLIELLQSPLNRKLHEVDAVPLKVPPLAIEKNHLAMLLGAGELDGAVYEFDDDGNEIVGLRHVVRGVTSKRQEYNEGMSPRRYDEETEKVTIKDVYSEIPELDLNGFGMDGKLYCWSQSKKDDEAAETPEGEPEGEQKRQTEGKSAGSDNHGYPSDYDYERAAKLARMTVENGCTPAEAALAAAMLKCMRDGREFKQEEWVEWIASFVAKHDQAAETKAA